MINRKITKKYYFSVEGETEQWYLKWLQNTINSSGKASCKVSIDCPVQKNPLKRAKSINNTGKVEIWHLSDYESNDEVHQRQNPALMVWEIVEQILIDCELMC